MIKASIYKPITMLMVILTVVVFGLYTYSMMVVDLMPKFDVPVVTATIIYQGANPEENKMLKAQSDLKAQSFEAEAGGGMVKVAMNGKGVITMIKINPDAVDKDDVEALEDLVMAAVNSAVKKKDDAAQSSLSDITGGMKIPGLM